MPALPGRPFQFINETSGILKLPFFQKLKAKPLVEPVCLGIRFLVNRILEMLA